MQIALIDKTRNHKFLPPYNLQCTPFRLVHIRIQTILDNKLCVSYLFTTGMHRSISAHWKSEGGGGTRDLILSCIQYLLQLLQSDFTDAQLE